MAYTISNEPLTFEQFDFIQDQLDLHATDVSVRSISEMDGFFAAVISYKEAIHFNDWYAAFWGGPRCLPKWKSEQVYQRFFDLLIQHLNQVSLMLGEYPDDFSPIYNEAEHREGLDIRDWCQGYERGTALGDGWAQLPESEAGYLQMITMHTLGVDVIGADQADQEVSTEDAVSTEEAVTGLIHVAAVTLFDYWFALRPPEQDAPAEVVRSEPKVGRNDPCPCGSGKKYKKCCGAAD
ncbi:UPF0149 family protein [Pseudomonas abieticivorans]|uniref:UPF0149 family protein n=1 Tax=Pseudomonas abieticivorans TaxID=2931382 RepID=UPI003F68F0AE